MTESKSKSLKFKVLFFGGAIFILLGIIASVLWLLTKDISDEELGPSPFKVDESIYSNDNEEYKRIIEIGSEIKSSYEEEEKNYQGESGENYEHEIFAINGLLQKNEGIIEKVNLSLFKNCIFPKPKIKDLEKVDPYEATRSLQKILKLIQYRITYYIHTNNYQATKNDILLLSSIFKELFSKCSSWLDIQTFIYIKKWLNGNIGVLINKKGLTEEQKFELLTIEQDLIPGESLKRAFHFEIINIKGYIQKMGNSNTLKPILIEDIHYYPVYSKINYQANNTTKLLREMISEKIELVEEATYASYLKLNDRLKIKHNKIELFEKNLGGKNFVEELEPVLKLTGTEVLDCNNIVSLINVGKKLLEYKFKMGYLPEKLSDLNIDPKMYTDIFTGDPFLYSANKGILQRLGKYKKYWDFDLINKDLTEKEFQDKLINSATYGFVLYLK